jgi:outer membrane protein assembly factor BamB
MPRLGVVLLVIVLGVSMLSYGWNSVIGSDGNIVSQRFVQFRHASTPSDDWPTYHGDMLRSGYDSAFPQFTSVSLHWRSTILDGDVYAEPLILGTDVIVATENNSLYELSATTGQALWHINLGTPVNGGLPCGDISPSGITGTPVIDVSGRTIFVVAFLQSPQLDHELFAIDLDTGNVKFHLTIDPQGSDPTVQQQRAALALANGYVYVPYGGLDGDCGQYHGWLAATNTNGGGPVLSYQVPTGRAGAIWGGGDGPAVDNSGDLLVATGNSDATSSFDYGDAVLKLSPATSPPIRVVDWFAPSNWASLNQNDIDLGSTEPRVLSSNYLFQIGKEGVGYVLNATHLGGIGGELYSAQVCNGGGAYGGLAYSSPHLIVPCDNGVVALNVNLGSSPSFSVAWRGPNFLAGPPIIAGNAVWDVDAGNGVTYALNLTTGQTLFQDAIGSTPTHFNSLSAGDGQIFVSASRQVRAYLPQLGSMQTLTTGVDSGSGTISPDCSGGCSYGVGQSVTVTANPSTGWQFSTWSTISGISPSSCTGNPCTFTMPNNPVILKASFTSTLNVGQITSVVSANARSAWIAIPDYTAGQGSAMHISSRKCGGVAVAYATDVYAATYFGALTNTQNEILDTNSAYVSQSASSCGQPTTPTSQPIVAVAGPLVNEVVHYYESALAPLYYKTGTGCIVRRDSGANVDCSTYTATNDVFLMEAFKDPAGRTVFIIYGRTWSGTLAGLEYLVDFILKNPSAYTFSWYVYRWNDAASGVSANSIPDAGDSFTRIAAGP